MGRVALTTEDEAAFRQKMREVATRRFAEHGEAGVTMRGLAKDLGCSPMTPYRYFRDKAEIFTLVRAAGLEVLAEFQDRAIATERDPVRRLHAIFRAYVAYALEYPDHYRVMMCQPYRHMGDDISTLRDRGREEAAIVELALRCWLPMRKTVAEAVALGAITGDPDEIAHVVWASVHGLISLHLAGKLRLGRDLHSLIAPAVERSIGGPRVRFTKPPRRKTSR
jgi:AcrR family transcriptional regulator